MEVKINKEIQPYSESMFFTDAVELQHHRKVIRWGCVLRNNAGNKLSQIGFTG